MDDITCVGSQCINELTCPIAAVPGAPSQPDVSEVRCTSCMLSWQPPTKDGGAPITGYIVERRSGKTWIPVRTESHVCKYEMTGLNEGAHYEFRVLAENKAGQSKPSPNSESIFTKDPWSEFQSYLSLHPPITLT